MRLAATWLAAAACGEGYSLEVSVHHPAEASIASTRVSIYESNTSTCRQIELGDLSTAELQAILVAEQTIGASPSGSLDGISRTDRKLVVARGFDAEGRYFTAGCTEKEEITGRDVVQVDTDLVATLSINAVIPGDSGIPFTLTDALGRSLTAHEVTWRVHGPDGAAAAAGGSAIAPAEDEGWELAAPMCTDDFGGATVHPVPPKKVGGYAISIRPKWPSQSNTLLTSFTRVEPDPAPMTQKMIATRPCAIRVSGLTRRLACVQLASGGNTIVREYEVMVQDGDAKLMERNTALLDPRTIALVSVERSPQVRDVYAVTSDAQVIGVFQPMMAPTPGPRLPATSDATDAVLMPPCETGQPTQILMRVVTQTDTRLQVMPLLGGAVDDYHSVRNTDSNLQLGVRSTGCVAELKANASPRRRQAAVVELVPRMMGTRGQATVHFECELGDRCRANLPAGGNAGAGLSPPPRAGATPAQLMEEPRLTGVFFDASGVVMSSWVVLPNPDGNFRLVERERVPSAAVPRTVVFGHFDTDGLTDMFWDLPNAALLTSNLQVTYGRKIGAQRLSALSGAESVIADDVLAGDLTGDDMDDVVLVGRQRTDGSGLYGVIVIPMSASIANPHPAAIDKPCP